MPYDFQVAVDCADAHGLADWWAETLDWVVEEQDPDFIRMIAEGYATDADTAVRGGRLVWSDGAAIRHPDAPASDRASGSSSSACPIALRRVSYTRIAEVRTRWAGPCRT
jgi:hypothetical protein